MLYGLTQMKLGKKQTIGISLETVGEDSPYVCDHWQKEPSVTTGQCWRTSCVPRKKQENTLVQTMSYGWTQSKRVVSKTQTRCLRNQQNTTPGSRQRMQRCGHSL